MYLSTSIHIHQNEPNHLLTRCLCALLVTCACCRCSQSWAAWRGAARAPTRCASWRRSFQRTYCVNITRGRRRRLSLPPVLMNLCGKRVCARVHTLKLSPIWVCALALKKWIHFKTICVHTFSVVFTSFLDQNRSVEPLKINLPTISDVQSFVWVISKQNT